MKKRVQGILSSISLRLLVPLLGTMALVFATYGLLSYRATSARWTRSMEACALRTTELVKAAGHNAMLLNQKHELQETIQSIARTPGVAAIRVYDKEGTVAFASEASEIGRQLGLENEACVACHLDGTPERAIEPDESRRVFRTFEGGRALGVITPIPNLPDCATGGCHPSVEESPLIGVLEVDLSMEPMEAALHESRSQVVWLTAVTALVVALMTILFVHFLVRRPVRGLHRGIERLAAGDLETRLPVSSRDELGRLAVAFNAMTAELGDARAQLTGWSEKLEHEVEEKTAELGRIQRQVVHMEKMASLGKLSATVAHEINNPLAGILTYAKLVERDLREDPIPEEERDEMRRYLSLIQKESARCGDIVRNLLLFARQSGRDFSPCHLNEILDRSLLLLRHHMEMARVTLESRLVEGDDEILCDSDQVQQALVALLINAVEAMGAHGGGTLTVHAEGRGDHVRVEISDTGGGIPDEVLPHIFEPFFSTKNKESGVGLGLAVVFGIIQRHAGEIEVDTRKDEGTTFRVDLPRRPKHRDGDRELPAA